MDMISEASMRLKWGHSDYDEAKRQIYTYLGDMTDIEVFGRQVLVAAYIRPDEHGAIRMTKGAQAEDFWQGKAALVIKCGPNAFRGDEAYEESMYGKSRPMPGDWLFAQASAGLQMMVMGEGGKRIQGEDRRGEKYDLFDWNGWPCRIVGDDNFLGRLLNPTSVV